MTPNNLDALDVFDGRKTAIWTSTDTLPVGLTNHQSPRLTSRLMVCADTHCVPHSKTYAGEERYSGPWVGGRIRILNKFSLRSVN